MYSSDVYCVKLKAGNKKDCYFLNLQIITFVLFYFTNMFLLIKMDLQEVGRGRGDWMDLVQDRDRWRALVGTVRDFRVP
jgi:hypothetical protein